MSGGSGGTSFLFSASNLSAAAAAASSPWKAGSRTALSISATVSRSSWLRSHADQLRSRTATNGVWAGWVVGAAGRVAGGAAASRTAAAAAVASIGPRREKRERQDAIGMWTIPVRVAAMLRD